MVRRESTLPRDINIHSKNVSKQINNHREHTTIAVATPPTNPELLAFQSLAFVQSPPLSEVDILSICIDSR